LRALRDPKVRKGFIKDTTRRIADAHLAAEFGVSPFIRDCFGLWDELQGLEQKIKRLKAHAGRPQVRHYRRVLPYAPGKFWEKSQRELLGPISLPNLAGDPWVHWFWGANGEREVTGGETAKVFYDKRWIVRPVYHATMRYQYSIPRFDTVAGEKIALYTEAFGVRLDPSIPWNAARLSFLVDWVVDVSGFLSSFARENYPLNTQVLDFCHSLTWHSESSAFVLEPRGGALAGIYQDPRPAGLDRNVPLEVYREVDKHYERYRATPSLEGLMQKRATLRKAALAGSLCITNSSYLAKGRGQYLRHLPQTLRELQQIRERTSRRKSVAPPSRGTKYVTAPDDPASHRWEN
jgi:hypothetical protein